MYDITQAVGCLTSIFLNLLKAESLKFIDFEDQAIKIDHEVIAKASTLLSRAGGSTVSPKSVMRAIQKTGEVASKPILSLHMSSTSMVFYQKLMLNQI